MKRSLLILLAVALATVAADQLSKYVAVSRLTTLLEGKSGVERVAAFYAASDKQRPVEAETYRVLEGYAQLRYVENPGAAFALLNRLGENARRHVLVFAGALAIGFLLVLFFRAGAEQPALRHALSWLIGGALGNFVDRIARGYVIDLIELHWRDVAHLRWPTFNVADLGICLGVTLLLREILRAQPTPRPANLAPGLSRS